MRLALLLLTAALLAGPARGDDERDRKAKAALALAGATKTTAKAKAAKTAKEILPDYDYARQRDKAVAQGKPLVCYVGCDVTYRPDGALVAKAAALGTETGPAVIVGFPLGDKVVLNDKLDKPTEEEIDKAVERAINAGGLTKKR